MKRIIMSFLVAGCILQPVCGMSWNEIENEKRLRTTGSCEKCFLKGDLSSAIKEARKTHRKISLKGSYLSSPQFIDSDLSKVDFKDTTIVGPSVFKNSNLSGAKFKNAEFKWDEINFTGSNLSNTNFENARFSPLFHDRTVTFEDCNLSGSRFKNVKFTQSVNFINSDLSDTNFKNAIFLSYKNHFKNSNLNGANFTRARNLDHVLFSDVKNAWFANWSKTPHGSFMNLKVALFGMWNPNNPKN